MNFHKRKFPELLLLQRDKKSFLDTPGIVKNTINSNYILHDCHNPFSTYSNITQIGFEMNMTLHTNYPSPLPTPIL